MVRVRVGEQQDDSQAVLVWPRGLVTLLGSPSSRFTDPDAFLACDAPAKHLSRGTSYALFKP
jgi:hypothetical protein